MLHSINTVVELLYKKTVLFEISYKFKISSSVCIFRGRPWITTFHTYGPVARGKF